MDSINSACSLSDHVFPRLAEQAKRFGCVTSLYTQKNAMHVAEGIVNTG